MLLNPDRCSRPPYALMCKVRVAFYSPSAPIKDKEDGLPGRMAGSEERGAGALAALRHALSGAEGHLAGRVLVEAARQPGVRSAFNGGTTMSAVTTQGVRPGARTVGRRREQIPAASSSVRC